MIALPEFLKDYVPEAQKLLEKSAIKEIEFSGATYQVKVFDPKRAQDYWAFIQLDPEGHLQDAFCSCGEEEQLEECVHLTAAFLHIFQDPLHPLHERFEHSLWNQLAHLFKHRYGVRPKKVTKGKKRVSFSKELIFNFSNSQSENLFYQLFEMRPLETEETSLKFSNLSDEEIELWREGKPSEELAYELSFWADLAKKMMLEQDSGLLKGIHFEYDQKKFPIAIIVEFANYSFTFYLKKKELAQLIPALNTVNSPLKVFNRLEDFVLSAKYDEKKGVLFFEPKPLLQSPKGLIIFDHWTYQPTIGFYPKETHPLLKKESLQGSEIAKAFDRYAYEIAPLLKTTPLHLKPVKAHTSLEFDRAFNLCIKPYVLKKGDLSKPRSRLFEDWAYVENEGFFHLYGLKYRETVNTIPEDKVADFIRQEASWLNTQSGFTIHLQSLEAQVTYHIAPGGRLSFERKISLKGDGRRSQDFGPWIYVEGEGFYSKTQVPISLPLQAGLSISPDQIPGFIRLNRKELELVSRFFCPTCPFEAIGLHISLTELDTIQIIPFFQIKPEFLGKRLKFFDDIVYVEDEGFYELPLEMRLPEKYREVKEIQSEEIRPFLLHELEDLKHFIASLDPRLKKPAFLNPVIKNIQPSKEGYLLKIAYRTDLGELPLSDLFQAYQKKPFFLFSEKGLIDLTDNRFEWFKGIREGQLDFANNELHLSRLELIRLQATQELQYDLESGKLLKEIIDFKIDDLPPLTGLKGVLRPYQEKGVMWLYSLYLFGLSGLLCDDMGLGKTHQAMGLFSALLNQNRGKKLSFLVVCPTSVLYHWEEKLRDYMPDLKILTYHGLGRKELIKQNFDLLLTSYGILRNEIKFFQKKKFDLAVFDEIQIAKNHLSRLHASLLQVNAKMRLGLTGTPIENRIRELKALFDIVLPFYMPKETDYVRNFVRPIERDHDMQQKNKLSRMIKPFILRRKKSDVLLDLPDKAEEIAHCDLREEQAALYRDVLSQGRIQLMGDLRDTSKTIPYIHVFALLTRLKQVVDHPALYLKQIPDYKKYHSGKWDLFVELLQEARDSEQKVVVFSQYLGMLDIIEAYLKAHGIGFAGLRGTTKNRAEQIRLFNTDPKCEVFVASLRAAGLGIDLTAGSVVIHYDRWWNKAREDQATDRVHRIGQHRNVQVFKLVTKSTFEERIHQLIEHKGQLLEDVVGVDDHDILKRFTREELMQLLQGYE